MDTSDIETDTYLAPDDPQNPPASLKVRCAKATKELPSNCSALWELVIESISAGEQRDYDNRRLMRKIDGRLQSRVYALEAIAKPVMWAAKIIGYTVLSALVIGFIAATMWLITAMGEAKA